MKTEIKQSVPDVRKNLLLGASEILAELELTMTQSSIGFEYTLKELDKQAHFGFDLDCLQNQLEELQNMYFEAREKFLRIDVNRLEEFEDDLRKQKAAIFNEGKKVYH